MPKHKQQPHHPFLAQMLFRYVGPVTQQCQSANHEQLSHDPALAEWEVRMYQNTDRVVDLHNQGVQKEHIAQRSWDEACREQDTIGVRTHKQMYLCQTCAAFIVRHHGGEEAQFITMATAQATQGALLLVTDRLTEVGGVIGNVPGSLVEEDILPLLDNENMLDIRFKL